VRTPCQDEMELELWTSDDPADRLIAAAKCQPCHLIGPCLADALRRKVKLGVYGGHDFTVGKNSQAKADRSPAVCKRAGCNGVVLQNRLGPLAMYCSKGCAAAVNRERSRANRRRAAA
jgi:hypothetical protein